MSINSKKKGSRGELELAKWLSANGFPARRGQQYSGTPDSPDVVCPSLPEVHWECKRTERSRPVDWLVKAQSDAPGKTPVVIWRRNHGQPIAMINADQLLNILRRSDLVR